jgi:SAM-dependent methyltransferase
VVSTHQARVDPANTEQLRAWDGSEGAYWAAHPERFEQALRDYEAPLFGAAAIAPTDHVLDIGCGTGGSTRAAARRASAGSVLGIDLSSAMLEVARRTAEREGLANVSFVQADAQIHPFDEGMFDVAISRTGAMFFGNPHAAFTNIARALRPGGRLALLVWQAFPRNEWVVEIMSAVAAGRDLPAPPPDGPGPFSMSDPDRVHALLSSAGFDDVRVSGLAERMYFGHDPDDAHRFVAGLVDWMLDGLDDAARTRALDALHRTMQAHHTPQGVTFRSAAWLVTAAAARSATSPSGRSAER